MRLHKIAGILFVVCFLLSAGFPSHALAAGEGTTTGSLSLSPTVECIGVTVSFSGDSDGDNNAVMQYRVSGGSWKTAPDMYVDRTDLEYRGSIFWLNANTTYEVRVTFSDPDSVSGTNPVSGSTTTRNDNPAIGTNYYYVATTGNDSTGDGSLAKPWKTIQKAAGSVSAGATVLVRSGVYVLSSSISVTASGTASNYITFMPYNAEDVTINGNNSVYDIFKITGDYIRIKGFNFTNDAYYYEGGTIWLSGADYCIIEDNYIINPAGEAGIMIRTGSSNNIFQNNTIYANLSDPAGDNSHVSGFYWWKAGNSNVIRNNDITADDPGTLWDGMGGGPENTLGYMYNTDIYDNNITFSSTVPGTWDRDDGIQLEGGDINVRVWGNRIENSYVGIGVCPVMEGPYYVFRNVIFNPFGEMFKMGDSSYGRIYIYHNTYYSNRGADGLKQTNYGEGNIISRNNIIYASRYVYELITIPSSADIDFDYNSIYTTDSSRFVQLGGSTWGGTYTSFTAYKNALQKDVNSISVADNGFVNASGGNLQLQSSSPCIDRGIPLTGFNDADSPWPYQGNAPDLGAFESSSGGSSNNPPVAVNDSYSTSEDTALTVPAAGVLSNDTDADGNPLTANKVSNPANGTVTLNANGSFTYTPNANYSGADSFTYRAYDGLAYSNTATVIINVTPVNDAPVAVNDTYSTSKDSTLNVAAPGVLSNDTDADGNPLTAVQVSGPSSGTLTLNSNGSFTYTPNTGYTGSDSFTYRANDGSANSNTATVTINITANNNAPVAVNDSYATNEDIVLNVAAPGVMSNDTDADGNPLTASKVANPSHGSVTVNSNGSFSYTPASNYNGSDSFTYRVYDGAAYSNTATVTITIAAVNDAPAAVNNSYTTSEDTTLNVSAPGVLGNDTDVEGSTLTASVLTNPSHGTLTLNSNGSFAYVPAANYNGSDSFTYRAYDGSAYSNTATVTITITAVNDAPVAVADTYSTSRDTALTVAAPGVLSNDTDVEGSALTASQVSGPSHGTLTLNSNGSFTYTPAAGYTGTDSFTYRARDGSAYSNTVTVTITVNSTGNTPPIAINDTYNVNEDNILNISAAGVLNNDIDADNDSLTASKVNNPSHGSVTLNNNGSFTYTPAANYNGTDSFTYRANDGQAYSNTATVTINISPVNDPPVLGTIGNKTITEGSTLTITVTATDVDGDSLSYRAYNLPLGASFDRTAHKFSWTPDADQVGKTFTGARFYVFDRRTFDYETVSFTVREKTANPPSEDSGGGGGGGGGGGSGSTSLLDSMNGEGKIVTEVLATSADQKVRLRIPRDTIVKNADGGSATIIRIKPSTQQTGPCDGARSLGLCYDIMPEGITFTSAVTLTIEYEASSLPPDITENKLFVALWDPDSQSWTDLEGMIDTVANTVSVPIEHLSTYALMAHVRPATFQIADFSLTPAVVSPGEVVNASFVVKNNGDYDGTYQIELTLDDNVIQTRSVSLPGGTSETIAFTVSSDASGEHLVRAGDVTKIFLVELPASPATAFTVSGLQITPASVSYGGQVNISATVKNNSSSHGGYQAELKIDDNIVQTKEVSLDGGASEVIYFTVTSNAFGNHRVSLGELQVTFEVKPLAPPMLDTESNLELKGFSVMPIYNEATHKLVFAKVAYHINQASVESTNVRLVMVVIHDGEQLAQVPLLNLNQAGGDGRSGELSYVPYTGWEVGEYTFRAELFEAGNLVQDTGWQTVIVSPESITREVGWWTLGAVVGVASILILILVGVIIYRKRDMLKN